MRRVQALSMLALILLLPCGTMPSRVAAASLPAAVDMPLTPINTTESISLVAYTLHAQLRCGDAGCGVDVEQTYQVRNQGQETTLQLGLAATEGLPAYTLHFEGGQALTPDPPSADYAAIWGVRLGRNEQKRLVLTSSHAPQQGRIVSWLLQMSYLAPWGVIQGTRMEFVFPQPITDDALLVTQPGNPSVGEGGLLYWDYETLQEPQNLQIVALTPATWQEYQELRRTQRHKDLALLFEALYKEAQEKGVVMADPYERQTAEWIAALQAKPDDQDARQNLARLYEARAEAVPSLKLNYLLLLAEQLEALRERSGDAEMANKLVRIYEEASKIASENNDPAGALKYLRQAGAVPGAAPSGNQEMLTLRLALSLAQAGQAAEALQQVEDILAPDLRQVLWRYMPPFYSARADVLTGPQERTVQYQLLLYPPAAQKVHARLDELAVVLRAMEGCQVSWSSAATTTKGTPASTPLTTTFTMTMTYPSLQALDERSKAVVENLDSDPDLVSTFVAGPWRSAPVIYHMERGLWQDRLSYYAEVDLAPLQASWEEGADYVRWQVVELRNGAAGSERARIEQQLAVLMLEQQSQTWELIPSGTYYVHRVSYPEFPRYQPTWLVSWGQNRVLQAGHSFYRWERILAAAGVAALLLVLLLSRALGRL